MDGWVFPFNTKTEFLRTLKTLKTLGSLAKTDEKRKFDFEIPILVEMQPNNHTKEEIYAFMKANFPDVADRMTLTAPPARYGIALIVRDEEFVKALEGVQLPLPPIRYFEIMNFVHFKIHYDRKFVSFDDDAIRLFKPHELTRPLQEHEIAYLNKDLSKENVISVEEMVKNSDQK